MENEITRKYNRNLYKGRGFFDTAKCHRVYIEYNTKEETVEDVRIESNFMYTNQSTREWMDEVSYGVCSYYCNAEDLIELAECIKEHEWRCNNEIVDKALKTKILDLMMG